MKDESLSQYDIMTVGEANGVTQIMQKNGLEDKGKFNMIFQFEHLGLWSGDSQFDVKSYKEVLNRQKETEGMVGMHFRKP